MAGESTMLKNAKNQWTVKQMCFQEFLAAPFSRKTEGEFAKEYGIHQTTLSRWKRIPGFTESVMTLRKREVDFVRILNVLEDKAMGGNMNAIKYLFDLCGFSNESGIEMSHSCRIKACGMFNNTRVDEDYIDSYEEPKEEKDVDTSDK